MTTYARIVGSAATDITTTDPAQKNHPDLAATFVVVPDGTQNGWLRRSDGTFAAQTLPLSAVQAEQVFVLRAACTAAITGGFSSSSLGAAHTYPSTSTDQTNMLANASTGGDLWCEASGGAWSMVSHTADQAKAVLADFVTARDAARAKLATMSGQVQAASSPSSVQAIVWS
jgi:hypothetical protein